MNRQSILLPSHRNTINAIANETMRGHGGHHRSIRMNPGHTFKYNTASDELISELPDLANLSHFNKVSAQILKQIAEAKEVRGYINQSIEQIKADLKFADTTI